MKRVKFHKKGTFDTVAHLRVEITPKSTSLLTKEFETIKYQLFECGQPTVPLAGLDRYTNSVRSILEDYGYTFKSVICKKRETLTRLFGYDVEIPNPQTKGKNYDIHIKGNADDVDIKKIEMIKLLKYHLKGTKIEGQISYQDDCKEVL